MSAALRVLVIDDEEGVRTALQSELEERVALVEGGPDWEVRTQGFDNVEAALVRFRPDMVVLDLIEGQIPNEIDSGNRSFELIRDNWFCPVVVYTGFAPRRDFEEHAQVAQVTKGRDSEAQVLAKLREFVPVAIMIRSVHQEFDRRIREALRDSVDVLGSQIQGHEESQATVLSRAVRRQVAARVDLAASARTTLRAWERFLVPPLGGDLLTADLLRRRHAEWNDPEAFCMVLTPSCDLVGSGDRTAKVEQVLVAWCGPLRKLGKMELSAGKALTQNQRNSLRPILTEGLLGQQFVVPEFRGHVPLMAAYLKRLELVEWDRIDLLRGGNDETTPEPELLRVASTDSPFREAVAWAYLRVTGRPGLPEVDVDRWLDNISEHLELSEAT